MSYFKRLFFPACLMTIFLSIGHTLLHIAKNFVIATKHFDLLQASVWNPSSLYAYLLFGIALFLFSKKFSFEQVIRGSLIFLTASLAVTTFSIQWIENSMILSWIHSLFILLSHLFGVSFLGLFTWGFLNQNATQKEGRKYYILTAFTFSFLHPFICNTTLLLAFPSETMLEWDFSATAFTLGAIGCVWLAYFAFRWAINKQEKFEHEPKITSQEDFPYLNAAFILAGIGLVSYMLNLVLNSFNPQFSDPTAYSEFMSSRAKFQGIVGMSVTIFWCITGTWLMRKQGWQKTALCGALSMLIGGVVLFGYGYLSDSPQWQPPALFSGLINGTHGIVFFPLIQIAYLFFPMKERFQTKVGTEIIAAPVIKGLLTPLFILLLYAYEAMLPLLVLAILLLIVFACWRIGAQFKKS